MDCHYNWGDVAKGFELSFDYVLDTGLLPPRAEAMLGIMGGYLNEEVIGEYYQEAVEELKAGTEE